MIVGLGNPGPRYAANRHNIGFQCLELLARRHAIALDKMQNKAMVGQGWVRAGGRHAKVLLVKPLTSMNLVGESVAPLARFYQVEPAQILVIHDDLDMESGRLRLRPGGSSGGQQIAVKLNGGDSGVTVTAPANTWTRQSIPLASLGSPTTIKDIYWQDAIGGAQPVFFLDDISFTGTVAPPMASCQ
mgnify:CR=1 FL=1